MKEHPIPQDITGYRFHIIGNMTLKQFAEIATGFVIAGILYKIGLPSYIKYPLMVFSAGLGALAAFIPIEDRPLDHWIITFFQVLFRPTQFYWKRVAFVPDIFQFQSSQPKINPDDEIDMNPARRERIREFMASINPQQALSSDFTAQETTQLSAVLQYFSDPTTNSLLPQTTHAQVVKPSLTVRVRKLHQEDHGADFNSTTAQTELSDQSATDSITQPLNEILLHDQSSQSPQSSTADFTPTPSPTGPATELSVVQPLNTAAIDIPDIGAPNITPGSSDVIPNDASISLVVAPSSQTNSPQQAQSQTQFNANLPFPSTPTEPNKLVGMVLSTAGELVPGAIVEVIDEKGEMARAVKSNALGQFFITTPLPTGSYVIQVDKDDMKFATQNLEVHNVVLNPIELRALAN